MPRLIFHPGRLMAASVLAPMITLAGALPPVPVLAADSWQPQASEQLVKLPGDYLKKAVDNDYARSGLAAALTKTDRDIAAKRQSIEDLQGAVDRADNPDTRIELQHQLLEAKRGFIELMKRQQDLRARRARTKMALYERLLAKLNRKTGAATPQEKALIAEQTAARSRFEASAAKVDAALLRSSIAPESRYAREYAKNVAAIEKLADAVREHPMNQAPQIEGVPVSRGEYLRGLIAENQGELAVVGQQRTILGYMAKLVSLDALALSEKVGEGRTGNSVTARTDDAADAPDSLTGAVDLFVSR